MDIPGFMKPKFPMKHSIFLRTGTPIVVELFFHKIIYVRKYRDYVPKHNPNYIIYPLRLFMRRVSWSLVMIWQPKVGQQATINYKDKSMPFQGRECEVAAVGNGKGPKNVLVIIVFQHLLVWTYSVIPRGNLNAEKHT